MTTNTNYATMIEQTIAPLLPRGCPVALLDFPNHGNVGDSAIWLGEIEFLRRRLRDCPVYWVSDRTLSSTRRLPGFPRDTTILIHGGGNFGDLWPTHQQHRERVLSHYRAHRIIQLPQSIHFTSEAAADRCREILEAHPDFHLIVRDRTSLELARSLHDGPCYLCPDMALFLAELPRPRAAKHAITALIRTDRESVLDNPMPETSAEVLFTDWVPSHATIADRIEQSLAWCARHSMTLRRIVYDRMAERRVRLGCELLATGRAVVSDRLHAHILCTLMRIPHVVLDNSYRKIGNFRDTWGTGEGLCTVAVDLEEAVALAHRLAESAAG